jgi:hypothetical protein
MLALEIKGVRSAEIEIESAALYCAGVEKAFKIAMLSVCNDQQELS